MSSPLDSTQLQQQAQALEQSESWSELLELAQRQQPHWSDQSQISGYLDYLAGRSLLELEDPDQAEPLLRRASKALPEFPYVFQILGRSLADQKQWAQAVTAQERCIALKPDFGYAWLELGRARDALGITSAALQAYQEANKLIPNNDWLECRLIHLQVDQALQAGDHQAAAALIVALQQERAVPNNQLLVWLNAALTLAQCNRWEEATQLASAIRLGGEQAGRPSPLGTRAPLLLIALAVLMGPIEVSPFDHQELTGGLLETLWIPHDNQENEFWVHSLADQFIAASQVFTNNQRPIPIGLTLAVAQVASEHFNDHWRALSLLEQLALIPELTTRESETIKERCGTTCLGMGRPIEARRYLLTIPEEKRSTDIRSALSLAQLQLAGRFLHHDLHQTPEIAQQLLLQFAQRPRNSRARAALDELLWKLNSRVINDTQALAHACGPLATAQELRRQGLDLIANLTAQALNPPGLAPLSNSNPSPRRWLLLATDALPQCFLYRVEQKREQLESLDQDVLVMGLDRTNDWSIASALLWADILVVCRLPGTYPVLRAMGLAKRKGIPVYYDMDDLIFDQEHFPPPLESYGGTISASLHTGLGMDAPLFRAAMEEADALIFSTQTLARRWRDLHSKTNQSSWVLANMAPPALRREAKAVLTQQHQAIQASQLRLLVSSGTLAHKQVWVEELAPALASVLQKHPHLHLDLVGSVEWPEVFQDVAPERIRSLPFSDYPTYLRHVGRAHIGLAPLESGIVTDAKSAIKWMEYSLMGLASVVSPTATYQEILSEGENVQFASNREGWIRAIEGLISNPDLRANLAANAHKKAEQLFGQAQGQRFWQEVAKAHTTQPSRRRRKQLVINCFFAPQSVGGATRVAQNRVKELLAEPDQPEVTVLCVDLDPWQGSPSNGAIPLDIHSWHGAQVVRLSVPAKPWDWHHDGEVEHFCRDWFERENFDAIEAHSIQILTAAPLKVAREMGIPYTVILHDGWWLSQLQFLTRDDGSSVDPIDPLAAIDDDASVEIKAAAHLRRRDLFALLEGAEERLAVSKTFADLYSQAGVREMGVRVNTVAKPQAQELQQRRTRKPNEPVNICMVGGMAVHKGYAVFRAAVQQAELGKKAKITIVDHRLEEGDRGYQVSWSGTPVQFIAPINMSQMNSFYTSQDVLVAPSIWPESFGLVTREALQLGLWVIASDIGALAEPIDNGVNGLKVHPKNTKDFAIALKKSTDAIFSREVISLDKI
jgi:glycosyltransferase involved in cell wall biosynthesis